MTTETDSPPVDELSGVSTVDTLTDVSPTRPPVPGEVFHFLTTGMTFMVDARETSGVVAIRGQQFILSQAMLDANRDPATGLCFLDLLHDAEGQRARYARLLVAPGAWNDSQERTEPGTREHADARLAAVRAAHREPDNGERLEALRRVEERFGSATITSSTLATYER